MTALIDTLLDLSALPAEGITDEARATAQASLLDWIASGRAGRGEPVAKSLRAYAAEEGGSQQATLFGGSRAPARMAALVNGTISHAIDYDDTHFAHVGHLSVGIYPTAQAVGETTGASAQNVVDAFAIGCEAAIRVGMVLGSAHYNRGFHQTATAGAFGATVAAARLTGLNRGQTRAALGLVSTRASGLKSQFGTMGKPLNAGLSAANGVEAALLAAFGVTSTEDGLMGPQGFVPTHSDAPMTDVAPVGTWLMPDISYKFHACCHGTHAMIEALLALRLNEPPHAIHLRTNPRWLKVCNIATPATGLEVKFSYRWLAAMVMDGCDTGAWESFTDEVARDTGLAALAERVHVVGDDSVGDMQAAGHVVLADGSTLPLAHDLAARMDAPTRFAKLMTKAQGLLGSAQADDLGILCGDLSALTAHDLAKLVGRPA